MHGGHFVSILYNNIPEHNKYMSKHCFIVAALKQKQKKKKKQTNK